LQNEREKDCILFALWHFGEIVTAFKGSAPEALNSAECYRIEQVALASDRSTENLVMGSLESLLRAHHFFWKVMEGFRACFE